MPPRVSFLLGVVVAFLLAGCGGNGGGGGGARIEADGSSTVGPYVTAAAEQFKSVEPDVQVTVGISGTGGGFERFCRGETDLSNASRPIKDEEIQACEEEGVEYVELQVANDGIAVVVNKENDWATCATTGDLKLVWDRGSKIDNWRDLAPSGFPDLKLTLAGPGTDSGTFDFFTEAINGEEGRSRSDYNSSENDNVIVQAVSGDKGGLGYFGLSYAEQNKEKLKVLEVDGGDGCVAPSAETVQSGEYKPLSRPLFVYVKKDALDQADVKAFLEFMFDNEEEIADRSFFVPLTDEQLQKARDALGTP